MAPGRGAICGRYLMSSPISSSVGRLSRSLPLPIKPKRLSAIRARRTSSADVSMPWTAAACESIVRINEKSIDSVQVDNFTPPFGLDGPWRDKAATEFTLQAWSGGIVGLGRGAPDRPPVFVGGQVGDYLAGAYAAAATLISRRAMIERCSSCTRCGNECLE